MKRSLMTDGYGIPLDRVLAAASRHDSPLLPGTLDNLGDLGPLPSDIRVHLDAGYDSQVTHEESAARNLTGQIARKAGRRRSRPAGAGPSSGPMHGTTCSADCSFGGGHARCRQEPAKAE